MSDAAEAVVADARAVGAAPALSAAVSACTADALDRYAAFARSRRHGPAQSPVWVEAWARHASPDAVIVSVEREGATVLMLPLEVARLGPFRVARFVGGSHANGSLAPAANLAGVLPTTLLGTVRAALRASRPDIDLLRLERMSAGTQPGDNPFLLPESAESPNLAFGVTLDGGFAAVLRRASDSRKAKKHRSQLRKYDALGGFRRVAATTPDEVDRLLESFFQFKARRFRAAGIPDVFAAPEQRAAFRALFTKALAEAQPPFLLHGLEVGGALRAVTGSSLGGDGITCEFGAIADDEVAKHSPGEFLFYLNIEAACAGGFRVYDFGVGDERYKRQWCDLQVRHFDVSVPLSLKGRLLQASLDAAAGAKTVLKRNPLLWALVKRLRRSAAGTAAEGAGE